MKDEQKYIYYAAGETEAKIAMLPQVEAVKSRGYEVLYLTDDVDEFALKMLGNYDGKEFKSVTAEALDLATDDEKAKIDDANNGAKDMLDFIKESIGKVSAVKFSANLAKHPVCLSSEGELSVEMEKVLKKMPGAEGAPEAKVVLEINHSHPITEKLLNLFATDRDTLAKYSKILYSEACLIGGVSIEDPSELSELITELMTK
jgi:molecular chaperone HtpG